jgi:Protein of unknown function (DUF4238)
MQSKRNHFVPQHYLRQFRIAGTKQIAVAQLDSFMLIGPAAIRHQCQEDYFYENKTVDELMGENETNLTPVLIPVAEKESFDSKELVALRMLAATLHVRTRKAVETAKVVPKRIAYKVVKDGIERGELPAPEGGWKEGMMDFEGVPGFLVRHRILPAWLEMQTLNWKLLKAEAGNFFLTSDHPVVLLNQLFMDAEPHRSYVGLVSVRLSASLANQPDAMPLLLRPQSLQGRIAQARNDNHRQGGCGDCQFAPSAER